MKIIILCGLLALTCGFPTDTNSQHGKTTHDDKVPAIPVAYAHRPLVEQQGQVANTEGAKPKRDTSVIDTKKYHNDEHLKKTDETVKTDSEGHSSEPTHNNNAPASFVRPVPVSQVLGKINTDHHAEVKTDASKNEKDAHKQEALAPVSDKTEVKHDTLKAETLTAKLNSDVKVPVTNVKSKDSDSEESKEEKPERKTRDAPKPSVPSHQEKTTENKEVKTQTPTDVKVTSEITKVQSQTRHRREETPKSQLPVGDKSKTTVPTSGVLQDKLQASIVHAGAHEGAEISRLVRETPKTIAQNQKSTENKEVKDVTTTNDKKSSETVSQFRHRRDTPKSQLPAVDTAKGTQASLNQQKPTPIISEASFKKDKQQVKVVVREAPKDTVISGPTPVPKVVKVPLTNVNIV
uniref:CSON007735 protein n=1 Tax=Culicoides sonorensis TaxID=179676 RepID=A0A336N0Q2_CULSO